MSVPVSSPLRRYRRRILGLGVLGVAVLCGVGAPLYLGSVERDLEGRVPSELAEQGFVGVSAAFSGQDGVLRCVAPLAEPEDAIDAAIDVWGVRAIELDRSCRVGGSAEATDDEAAPPDATTGAPTNSVDDTTPGSTAPATTVPGNGTPDFDSILEVVASGPQFSILASLIEESDVAALLTEAGPYTLFAPTDDAFDAIAADTLAELRRDPDRLVALLRHHIVAGAHPSGALEPGDLEMLDESTLPVTVDDGDITIGGAAVTTRDLLAANGVVHAIDEVLLPSPPDDRVPRVSATLTAGQIVLAGTVADETQRAALVDAASRFLDPANIDDQLTISAAEEIDEPAVDALAELVAAMPQHLVRGVSGYDGTDVYTSGVFAGDDGRTAYLEVADFVSAEVELEARPTASADDAAALEEELNQIIVANPIQFLPASAEVPPDAFALLDRIAGTAEQFSGVTITIEGHTDSDGAPEDNQALSVQRALAVLFSLASRGVPASDLTSVGLGSTRPILVGGVEDKDASRRIEFRVTPTEGA